MPRFHFDFRDGRTLVQDREGAEFATLELAYEEAFKAAQEMWRDRLRRREDPRRCAFHITDGTGRVLTVVPLAEVLESCGGEQPPVLRWQARARAERARQLSNELADIVERTRETVMRSQEMMRRTTRAT